jgi:predicted HicB family RNase H-like nuclease
MRYWTKCGTISVSLSSGTNAMPLEKMHADGEYKLTIRLPQHLADRLKRLAGRQKRSLNGEIEYALERHVSACEGEEQEVSREG